MVAPFLSSNCVHRQVIYTGYEMGEVVTIHEKMGEVIDRKERDEYWLFGDMDGFISATFHHIPGGGYVAKIITARGVYHAVNRDPDAVAVLHDLIELGLREAEERKKLKSLLENYEWGFEKYRYGIWLDSWQWEWQIARKWKIKAYDGFGFPITKREIDLYRDSRASCVGAFGCLAFGAPLGAILGCVAAEGEPDYDVSNPEVGWGIFAGAVVVSVVGGAKRGNTLAEMRIINAIREARKPRKIE
jgi:hypothetical protein